MRIVLVQPYSLAYVHASANVHRLARELLNLGHEVSIVSAGFRDAWIGQLPVDHEEVIVDWKKRWMSTAVPMVARRWYEVWSVQRRGFELGQAESGSVVHFLDYDPVSLRILWRLFGCPRWILTLGNADFTFRHVKGRLLKRAYYMVGGRCLRRLSRHMEIVVHSERIRTLAVERGLLVE